MRYDQRIKYDITHYNSNMSFNGIFVSFIWFYL